jgi:hypothetical protein
MAQKTTQTVPSKAGKASPVTGSMTTAEVSVKVPQAAKSVPAEYEKWLYNNPMAFAEVKRGLADSAAGRGVKMSFIEFADVDLDE